jgi:hypothetical protein
MKIITGRLKIGGFCHVPDTIEISDADLNTIFGYFIANEVVRAGYAGVDGNTLNFETRKGITFAQYLNALISLTGEGK